MAKRKRRPRKAGQRTSPRPVLATDLPPDVLEDWHRYVGGILLGQTRAIFGAPWGSA